MDVQKGDVIHKNRMIITSIIGGILTGTIIGILALFLFENLILAIFIGFVLACFLSYSIYKNSLKMVEKNKRLK